MKLLLLLCAAALSALVLATTTQAGPYRVDVVTDPPVVSIGKSILMITVKADGKPVTDAQVRAITQMPGMPMGEHEELAKPVAGRPGVYSAPAAFAMEGAYEVRVTINGSKGRSVAVLPMQTGVSTAQPTGINFVKIGMWSLAAALAVFVVVRMRRTGQSVNVGQVFKPNVLWSLLLLGGALAVALYAINNLRRPGSMTPLAAQGMEMSTPAPEGSTPVVLATAERESLGASVRYTGQVKGYVEQDVLPRVTGTLLWMPFYVGDVVKKGQVIAKLDTSQLGPELAEKQAGVNTASTAIGVAQSDYREAQAAVWEAQAELEQFQGGLAEAKANLDAVKQDRIAADAALTSAEADLANAQAAVSAAEADQSYFAKQADRADSLLAAGAISQELAQRRRADAQKADAAVLQARQSVRGAQARLDGAKANIRKADAQTVMANKRIDQAQSELMTHHAHVRTTQAAAASAQQKIAQAQSQAKEADALYSGAAASKGYAQIVAETNGVVTDRLISAGTLVNPGQPILRIAQVSPVRLQANVAEADIAKIRVGATVHVWHRDTDERPLLAQVTSVSPSLDAEARTGVVEAVVQNVDRKFLPGQFLTMEIATGQTKDAVTVPLSAIHTTMAGAGQERFVWVAVETDGRIIAHRRKVKVGAQSGNRVSIISGLIQGDKVVVQGGTELVDGQSLSPQSAGDISNPEDSVVGG